MSGFSGQVLYEPFIYQMYNICFTSVPIMYYALFDWEFEKEEFMKKCELYKIGLEYSCFNMILFTYWLLYGLAQCVVIFFLGFYFILEPGIQSDGKDLGLWVGGHVAYGICIIVANLVIQFRFNNNTGWGEWTCVGMVLAYFTLLYLESMLNWFPQTYFIFDTTMSQGMTWIQIIGCSFLACSVEIVYRQFKSLNSYKDICSKSQGRNE